MDSTSSEMDSGQYRLDPLLLDQPPRPRTPRLTVKPEIPDHETISDFSEWILWPGIVHRKETHYKHPTPSHIMVFTNQTGKPIHIGWASHSTLWNGFRRRHTSTYYIYIHIPTIQYHAIKIADLYICQIKPYPGKNYLLISISNNEGSTGSILKQIMFPENKLPLLTKKDGSRLPAY